MPAISSVYRPHFDFDKPNFKKGDRVRLVKEYGQAGQNYRVSAPIGATATVAAEPYLASSQEYLIGVVWDKNTLGNSHQMDGGYFADQFELVTETFKAGDRVRYRLTKPPGSKVYHLYKAGWTGTVTNNRYNPESHNIKWDNGDIQNILLSNLERIEMEKSVDVKALAKAYFNGNTAEVERLLKPFKVDLLPTGAVAHSEDMKLTWVVTKNGVVSVDHVTGHFEKSTKSLEQFSEWVAENGSIVRVR